MAIRSRSPTNHRRHSLRDRTTRPYPNPLLHRAGRNLRGGKIQRRRLHQPPRLRLYPLLDHCRLRCCTAGLVSQRQRHGAVTCTPSRTNVPILEIHGGNDTRIPYEGGPDHDRTGLVTEGIPAWLGQWAGRDGCVGNATVGLEGGVGVNVTKWFLWWWWWCGAG